MRTETPPLVRLEDYRPTDYLIDRVALDIRLDGPNTRVSAILSIRANPEGRDGAPLVLDGDELDLVSVSLDGRALKSGEFEATPQRLTIPLVPARSFTLLIETRADPAANTKLMGLYRSQGVYCTQCEAEGFRRITYFLDRPDVLSVYTTRIEGDRESEPVLLGNGDLVEKAVIEGTRRHYAIWHDPHPKPSYLFAVVGGKLGHVAQSFTTMSGREVEIAVYVEPGKEDRAAYALDALERSMRWDEEAFGREYDLSVFNIVAVSDFNMGAMENKGLNIFNDKYVLASPQTATDSDYAAIEAIIGHEYFHNWSGNRVTCRDWFQLCLKEGLTVFRDQEFSSDMRSRPVHRITEVRNLRARQFPEDAGPLAHPVRPNQYREINNFYTATVYEKGAEVIRMLKTLIGPEDFRRGMDRYYAANDGRAATIEDFLAAFEEVTGRDLTHFARWYGQAGTPAVTARGAYDAAAGTYTLAFTQSTLPTPGEDVKQPLVIPIAVDLVSRDGGALEARSDALTADRVFVLDRPEAALTFTNVASEPVPSVLRAFSAPVKLTLDLADEDLLTLLRADSDPFNRWQSTQTVATRLLTRACASGSLDGALADRLAEALAAFLHGEALSDPAFAALVLALPTEVELAQEIARDVDPDRIFAMRQALRVHLGTALAEPLVRLRRSLGGGEPYSPDAASAGRRALRNAALDLVAAGDPARGDAMTAEQYGAADNMTDRLAALAIASLSPNGAHREALFADFRSRYRDEPLVLDKWFGLQAMVPEASTLDRVRQLMGDPVFSLANPNRVRALVGTFAMANPTQFHRADGRGYDFLAEIVMTLDPANPQLAARLLTAFSSWRSMEARRRDKADAALRRIAARSPLSPDVSDIVHRSLA